MIIIDTGTSNAFSIQRALQYLGYEASMVRDAAYIRDAKGIILPGVGSFDSAVKTLHLQQMIAPLRESVLEHKKPILGICIGMQMLFDGSDEGEMEGLGLLQGRLTKLKYDNDHAHKVPNTGFKNVILNAHNKLNEGLGAESYFYFNHSYALSLETKIEAKDLTSHSYNFVASFQHDNIFGVQYHPEKSQMAGLKILKNFIEICWV